MSTSNGAPIFIRPAELDDLPMLVSMARETFSDSYEHLNDPIHFWDYVDRALTEDVFAAEMQAPGSSFFLAFYDGISVGFCKTNLRNHPELPQDLPHIELERIYVQKLYKGLGVGAYLLQHAVQTGKHANCGYLWLGVWKKNIPAIAWYEKQGLKRFGQTVFMMGSEAQYDWLMYKNL